MYKTIIYSIFALSAFKGIAGFKVKMIDFNTFLVQVHKLTLDDLKTLPYKFSIDNISQSAGSRKLEAGNNIVLLSKKSDLDKVCSLALGSNAKAKENSRLTKRIRSRRYLLPRVRIEEQNTTITFSYSGFEIYKSFVCQIDKD